MADPYHPTLSLWLEAAHVVFFPGPTVNMDISGPSVLALTSSHPSDNAESSPPGSVKDGMPPEKLQELLWFFRREDRKFPHGFWISRKVSLLDKEEYRVIQPGETEMKQAFVLLKEESNTDPPADSSLPTTENAGQVTIQWKDGNVTTLYEDKAEVDI
ncbi:hypothetical protein JD844_014679 [Phrynosoma platyrhinos]|uniref:Uncharacterized protein n=1 Tax=Phrynosoma platyrhinos TaxID=52577 RepID=A0ABQ7SS26_PHRPL|nr:hypothetical protein JD844_014679 [Phrynosoma platyrhinos]